jgi:hypothetical protein
VGELLVLTREAREQVAHTVLADQQVVVVRRRGVLGSGHLDAPFEPRPHQAEQHRDLVLAQRRDLVVAAHERHDRPGRV